MNMLARINLNWRDRFWLEHTKDQRTFINTDYIHTNKPYKKSIYGYYIWRDFFQPVDGLWNVLQSIVFFIAAPFAYLGRGQQSYSMTLNFLSAASLHAQRGIIQILTTPLTWFSRMPQQLFLTVTQGSRIGDDKFRDLIEEINTENKHDQIDKQLLCDSTRVFHAKFRKACWRGRSPAPAIKSRVEQAAYAALNIKKERTSKEVIYTINNLDKVQNYTSLFSNLVIQENPDLGMDYHHKKSYSMRQMRED